MFNEDRVSSCICMEDKVSSDGPCIFRDLTGKASRGNKYLMVPFAWNGRVQYGYERCCNEREREIKIFEINRGYEMLVQVLNIERDEESELHYETEREEYLNKTVINDDKIIDWVLRQFTNGDWTKLMDSDKLYEIINGMMKNLEIMVYENNNNKLKVNKNNLVYKYVRYLFDDGG